MDKAIVEIAKIKTRGDFRQAIESEKLQRAEKLRRRERLAGIWEGLAEAYGNAFTNQFGVEPNQTWGDGLSQYPRQEVINAVGRVISNGGEYAPSLATILGEMTSKNAPNQHLMSRTAQKAMNTPIVDKSESAALGLEDETTQEVRKIGTPDTNPNYFKDLVKLADHPMRIHTPNPD